jgi:hypothetical protein
MPVEQDPFEQIVNVQWEGGLAVEFFDKEGPPVEVSRRNELSKSSGHQYG